MYGSAPPGHADGADRRSGAGCVGAAARLVHLGGQVDAGVAVEEAVRHQLESGGDTGLDREVLEANRVMQSEHVPEHDIGILDSAVLLDEVGDSTGAVRMIHVFAARITLVGIEGGD